MSSIRSLRRYASTVAVTVFTAVSVAGLPALAHVGGTVGHLWTKHIRSKTDARYFKKAQLRADDGVVNQAGDPVHWTKLRGVPAGFADGVDDTGGGGPATDVQCAGCVDTSDLANGTVSIPKLDFDPATQAELDSHAGSGDHDGRYFTEAELSTSDGTPPNGGSNRVHWDNLAGVPAGFADGVDDTGGGGSGWALTGNAGTNPATDFLGTTDAQAMSIRVNNARALRIEPGSTPNLIGGHSTNSATAGVVGAAIGGGGAGGTANRVTDDYGTVGGGQDNQAGDASGGTADRSWATVAGGLSNQARGQGSAIAGGGVNIAGGFTSFVGAGQANVVSASEAVIGGGFSNTASGTSVRSVIGGGEFNNLNATHTTIGGGLGNSVTAAYGTIAGGGRSTPADPATGNRVTDDYGTVGGGGGNRAGDAAGTTTDARFATVAGGNENVASGFIASAGGGRLNEASGTGATIGGGFDSTASASNATVGGGFRNAASADNATIAGGIENVASGAWATVAGGSSNIASAEGAAIGGGGSLPNPNRVTDRSGTISGGEGNLAGDDDADLADASWATVGGGFENSAEASFATAGGGHSNQATGSGATIAGGQLNDASGTNSTVAGGAVNLAQGSWSVVPGGLSNEAVGDHSLAAGSGAVASHEGSFVWADSSIPDFLSTAANEFSVRSTGGARFVSAVDGSGTPTAGVVLAPGAGSWSSLSDRDAKTGLAPADTRAVLNQVASLPISTWSYASQDEGIRHIGPMAQDFHAAFGVGDDPRYIGTLDADGVALAAIQGLNDVVEKQERTIESLRDRVDGSTPSSGPSVWSLVVAAIGLIGLGAGIGIGLAGRRRPALA